MIDAKAFVIVCTDTQLPCNKERCEGHDFSYHAYNVDNESAVLLLEETVSRIIGKSLRDNFTS